MNYQLFFLLLIAIGIPFFQEKSRNGLGGIKGYIIYSCFILILQSGLRNIAVGADTFAYYNYFVDTINWEWSRVWHNFYAVYVEGVGKDAGYKLLMKLFGLISSEYQIYLLFIATLFFVSFGRLLLKFVNSYLNVFISILIYQAFFYGFFSVTGLRQSVATSIVFFAIPFIQSRKLIPFSILIILAAFIHKSALIVFPFYFIAKLSKSHTALIFALIFFPIFFALRTQIVLWMTNFSITESYQGYATVKDDAKGAIGFILYLITTAILVLIVSVGRKADFRSTMMTNALSIAIILSPGTFIDGALMRTVQYFSVFTMFQLPNTISLINYGRLKQWLRIVTILILLFKIISRNDQYGFFWETMPLSSNY